MYPLLTLVTPHEAIRTILVVGLHANGAVAALLVAFVTLCAKPVFVAPLPVEEGRDWNLSLLTRKALYASVTEPRLRGHLG